MCEKVGGKKKEAKCKGLLLVARRHGYDLGISL